MQHQPAHQVATQPQYNRCTAELGDGQGQDDESVPTAFVALAGESSEAPGGQLCEGVPGLPRLPATWATQGQPQCTQGCPRLRNASSAAVSRRNACMTICVEQEVLKIMPSE